MGKARPRPGGMAHQLRQRAALVENQNLVPSLGTERELFFQPPQAHTCAYQHRYTHVHELKILKKEKLEMAVLEGSRDKLVP